MLTVTQPQGVDLRAIICHLNYGQMVHACTAKLCIDWYGEIMDGLSVGKISNYLPFAYHAVHPYTCSVSVQQNTLKALGS